MVAAKQVYITYSLSSPCGDKLQYEYVELCNAAEGLSSPCGDKLQCIADIEKTPEPMLSSPCGDKLQYSTRP